MQTYTELTSLAHQEMSVNQRFFFVITKQTLFSIVIHLIRDKQNLRVYYVQETSVR